MIIQKEANGIARLHLAVAIPQVIQRFTIKYFKKQEAQLISKLCFLKEGKEGKFYLQCLPNILLIIQNRPVAGK